MTKMISIIIPCFNDALFIEQAVNSALNQTYKNKEVIVVDDGSNEQAKEVLRKIEPSLDLLITQKNKGQSAARNRGIAAASGEFILVLDSDDFFEYQFCEIAINLLKLEKVNLVTCKALLHFEDGAQRIFTPAGGKLENFLFSNSAIGNALFKKVDWQQIGGYDEKMRQGWEDWEFYIRLMQLGGRCEVIPEVLFHYRKRDNTTTDKANNKKYELYKYIFTKHKKLYINHYDELIDFLLNRIKQEEQEKIKNRSRIEFLIGKKILAPIRFLKSKLK